MGVRIAPPKPMFHRWRRIAIQNNNVSSTREVLRTNGSCITHLRGLSSTVEPKSVKLVTEVQFFQSPPYYYEHIQTSMLITMWLIKKSLRFLLTFGFG